MVSERRVLKEKSLVSVSFPFFLSLWPAASFFFRRAMGRTPADRPLKVNPKKGPGGGQLACADELAAFLACMMVRVRRGRRAGRRVPAAASIDGGEQRGANHPLITHSSPRHSFPRPSSPLSLPSQTSRMDAEGACAAPRRALDACAAAAASRTKVRSTINYHLQRLSRALRR